MTGKRAGKLAQVVIDSLVESRPGERFAIERAWQAAARVLGNKWTDERLWSAVFDEVPWNERAVMDLTTAVEAFYKRPADTGMARALRQILQEPKIFSTGIILKTVREFTETLTEELFLVDEHFREVLSASTDPLLQEIVRRATLRLQAEPVPPQAEQEEQAETASEAVQAEPADSASQEEGETLPDYLLSMLEDRGEAHEAVKEEETRETVPPQPMTLEEPLEPAAPPVEAEPPPFPEAQEAPASESMPAEEPPLRTELAAVVSQQETRPLEKKSRKKTKPYEAWIEAKPATEEILRIQQQAERWQAEAKTSPGKAKIEEPASSEPQPVHFPSAEESIQASELPAEELPPEPEPAPVARLKGKPPEEENIPPEILIRAELASLTETTKKSVRKETVFKKIGKLFSRAEKAKTLPPAPEVTPTEPGLAPAEEAAETLPETLPSIMESQAEIGLLPAEAEAEIPPEIPTLEKVMPPESALTALETEEIAEEIPAQAEATHAEVELLPAEVEEITAEIQALTEEIQPEGELLPADVEEITAEIQALTEEIQPEGELLPAEAEEITAEIQALLEETPPEHGPLSVKAEEVSAEIPLVTKEQEAEAGLLPAEAEALPGEAPVQEMEPEVGLVSAEAEGEFAAETTPGLVETQPSAELSTPVTVIGPEASLPAIEAERPRPLPEAKAAHKKAGKRCRKGKEEILEASLITAPIEPEAIPAEPVKIETSKPVSKRRKTKVVQIRPEARFVGRETLLIQAAAWLKKGKRAVVVCPLAGGEGKGGAGKSTLAREYVVRHGKEYRGGVFWFNFRDPELIPHEIAARAEGPPGRPLNVRIKQVLEEWQNKTSRLLIFDHCEDPALLAEWMPAAGASRVLVTSNRSEWDRVTNVECLPLGKFERAESLALLKGLCTGLELDEHHLDAIAAELGDHPLALRLAGSLLAAAHGNIRPDEYLNSLLEAKTHPHQWLGGNGYSLTADELSAGRALKICLDHLDENNPPDILCRRLLEWMATLAPDVSVPKEFLQNLRAQLSLNDGDLEKALDRLVDLGTVERNSSGQIWMHEITAHLIPILLPEKAELKRVERAMLTAAVESNRMKSPARLERLFPHFKHLTDRAIDDKADEVAASLANELGYAMEAVADLPAAQYYYERALTINHKTLGQVHPNTAICLNNLGHLLGRQGEFKDARLYLEEALDIRLKLLGENHPDTGRSLNNLGNLLQKIGDYPTALTYYERALAVRREVVGEKHPETAICLNNLGSLAEAMGNTGAARAYYEQALSIRKEALGMEHPDTAASLNDLGCHLQMAGEYGAARSYLEQSLRIRKKTFGEDNAETARSLNNLGELMLAKGNARGAIAYLEPALATRRKMLGQESLETATTLYNLGDAYQASGDYSKAQAAFEEALEIRKKIEGQAHPEVAANLEALASVSQAKGDEAAAKRYFGQAATMRKSLEIKKLPKFIRLSPRARTIVAVLFVFCLAIFGYNAIVPGPAPTTLNWSLANAADIPLLQPLKLFAKRTPTPTPTKTATVTASPTATNTATTTYTKTRVIIIFRPTVTPTISPFVPTKTKIYWTNTFTSTPIPPPADTATFTPSKVYTPTTYNPIPTNTPIPTDTLTPFVPPEPPTDTPVTPGP